MTDTPRDDRDHLAIGPEHLGASAEPFKPTLVIHHELDGSINLISDEPITLIEVYERIQGAPVQSEREVLPIGPDFIAALLLRATGKRQQAFIARANAVINGGRPKLSVVRRET